MRNALGNLGGVDQALDHARMQIRHLGARHDRRGGERFTRVDRSPDGVDLGLTDQFLRGVHRLGRIALGIAGDDFDLAALDRRLKRCWASTAKLTPRLKPMVGAELGPVIAASQPILIGSVWAIAGFGNENVAAPSAPALPNNTSRRETAIYSSRFLYFSALVVTAGARGIHFAARGRTGVLKSNLSLMWTPCPEFLAGGGDGS